MSGFAQNNVGIGTRNPNPNAALHIVAPQADQGLLIPTLSTAQRTAPDFTSALGSTENGLLVFDTDEKAFFYWMDNTWQPLLSGRLGNLLQAGTGIEINEAAEIINTGDTDTTDDVTINTQAGGDLQGVFSDLQIAADAVGNAELAAGSVTSEEIANATILPEDLQSPGAAKVLVTTNAGTVFWENQTIFSPTTFLRQGRVFVGDSDNNPSEVDLRGEGTVLIGNGTSANAVPISGDISLSSTGTTQIQADAVTALEIAASSVASEEIVDASITSADMADGAVTQAKIADLSVSTPKLADNAVDASKLAADAVNSDKVEDNSLTSADLLDGTISNVDVSATAGIAGSKINPDFDSQDITTTGNLNAEQAAFSGKVTSSPTVAADPGNTLTTKGYVDGAIADNSQPLQNGNGIADFSYNGSTAATVAVNAGDGLAFSAGGALQVSGVTSAMIADGSITDDDISPTANIQLSKLAGIGSMASQDADAVAISGGSLSGITDLAIADGGTGASTASAARSNLGLGSIATQNAGNVNITGGNINGTVIGDTNPAAGTFTSLNAATLGGDGGDITALNATNITTGTLNAARLPASGVTADTYGGAGEFIESVTVDNAGRITGISANVPPSDRRLKKNIQALPSSLYQFMQLQPAQYTWKDKPDAGISYGLIAQELAQVYPHLVQERSDGYLGVNYLELIPLLIKAIQEQQQQIESLRSHSVQNREVEQLRQENEVLRREIELIKEMLGAKSSAEE
ncbi:MAG: tail fiber domain-containing protein [Cyclobacteriaceae bacterium]